MIILLGSSGYVGKKFASSLSASGLDVLGVSRCDVSYAEANVLRDFLKDIRPSFLINAAGFTGRPNVDACEFAKYECLQGNAVLPGIIREVCEDLKLPWGHISSGCIYSGRRDDGKGWKEEDEPNFSFRSPPCSFYSGSKALGEEILQGAENCYVWRMRIPFNEEKNPRNYLEKLLNYHTLLDAENSISHIDEFVAKCIDCFREEVEPGVYNLTNVGSITTRQVPEWMSDEGFANKDFQFFNNEKEFLAKAANTPRSNCVLDTTKAEKAGIAMIPVEEAVKSAIQNMKTAVCV